MDFVKLFCLFLLLNCTLLLKTAHSTTNWHQHILRQNWTSLQYTQGATAINVTDKVRIPKELWLNTYTDYFYVPRWLAEEKFA